MRKMTLTFAAGLFVVMGFLFTPTTTRAVIFTTASTCEAANLGQALQGIGWSQFGVRNNASTSFFRVYVRWFGTLHFLPTLLQRVPAFWQLFLVLPEQWSARHVSRLLTGCLLPPALM